MIVMCSKNKPCQLISCTAVYACLSRSRTLLGAYGNSQCTRLVQTSVHSRPCIVLTGTSCVLTFMSVELNAMCVTSARVICGHLMLVVSGVFVALWLPT